MKYLIIGGSAAGMQAAQELRTKDPQADITLISKEKETPYSRCLLSRYVDGRMDPEQFYFKTRHFFEDYRIEAVLGKTVTDIRRKEKTVLCDDGQEIPYEKLLIATGSRPWLPDIEGIGMEGVSTFHSLADARKIKESIPDGKKAVVLGAGFIGLEAAYALSQNGIDVTVIEKSSQLLPRQIDLKASQILQSDLEELGIRIQFDESVFSINGNGRVESVTLMDQSQIPCDLLILAVGVRPNHEIAQKAGLETDRAIIVDEFFRTSDPDIYAAGDVIEINDVATGKRDLSATWFNAVLHGKYAASNMAGARKRYTGAVGIQNAVQFHRIPVISFGKTLLESEDERKDHEVISISKKDAYQKLILRGNRICGMIFVHDIIKSGFYASLIRNAVDISAYRNRLLDPDFSYAYFKDQTFGEVPAYFNTDPCWEGPDWWTHRLQCQMGS